MYSLPRKLQNMTPYTPHTEYFPIRLDANESPFLPSETAKAKIKAAIDDIEFDRYPDPAAKNIRESYAELYGIDPDLLVASNGSDEIISVIINAFCDAGESVCVIEPDFSMYRFYAEVCGLNVISIKKKDFVIDPDEVIKTANESNAQLLIFSNPCNPTSVGLDRDSVRRIIKNVRCLVVLDEAYMDFYDQSLMNEVEDYDNLMILRTCSKMLGLAALRVGITVSNKRLVSVLNTVRSPYNVNTVSAKAASIILNDKEYIRSANRQLIELRDRLYEGVKKAVPNECRVIKPCTNFVTVVTDKAKDIYDFLKTKGVLIRCFDGFIRITAGTADENNAVVSALEEFFYENR